MKEKSKISDNVAHAGYGPNYTDSGHDGDESGHARDDFEIFENPVKEYLESPEFERDGAIICRSKSIYDPADIEDIITSVRIKLLSTRSRFHYKSSVKTYVGNATLHRIFDWFREKSAQKRDGIEMNIDSVSPEVLKAWYSSSQTVLNELEIEELFQTLSKEDKLVLHVWRCCDHNRAETVREVVRLGIKSDFNAYKFECWREKIRERAAKYITPW